MVDNIINPLYDSLFFFNNKLLIGTSVTSFWLSSTSSIQQLVIRNMNATAAGLKLGKVPSPTEFIACLADPQ